MARRRRISKRELAARRRRRLTVAAWVAAAVGLALLVGGLVYVSQRLRHPQIVVHRREYPISGIDVSSHNGSIDFRRVARDSITFVYIKASEGADFRDSRFAANFDSASAAGLRVGAYHFFRLNGNGHRQAQNLVDAVGGRKPDLPLAIDVEDWGNESARSNEEVRQNLRQMIDTLQQLGHRVVIYTNLDGHRNYISDHFPQADLWLCTFRHPRRVTSYDWKILQYSHWGNVDGVEGEVDLNVFYGDSLQWQQWLQR